jgi:hypothetical protein
MRLRSGLFAFAVVCAALISQRAEASAILFTDRAAFEEAAQPDMLATFDSFEPLPQFGYFCRGDIALLGCYGTVDGFLSVSTWDYEREPIGSLEFHPVRSNASMGVDSGMIAIGFDLSSPGQVPEQWVGVVWYELGLFGVEPTGGTGQIPLAGLSFLGFVFDAPMVSIRIGSNGGTSYPGNSPVIMDNVAIRTPEPATSLLVFAGAMVLLQRRRFMREK